MEESRLITNQITPMQIRKFSCALMMAATMAMTSCAVSSDSSQRTSVSTPTVEGYVVMLLQPEDLPSFQFERPKLNSLSGCKFVFTRGAREIASATLVVHEFDICDSAQDAKVSFKDLTDRNSWEHQLGDRPELVSTLNADEADAWCYETDLKLVETGVPTPTPYPKKICQIVNRFGRVVTRMGVNSDSGKPLSPSIDELAALMAKKIVEIKKVSQQLK